VSSATSLAATVPPAPRLRDVPGALNTALYIALFFSLGVFVNSFTKLPLTFLLKEQLRLNETQFSMFTAVSDWAWYIKPAFGLLSDRVPLWGSRRRSYLILMGTTLLGTWVGLALAPSYRYGPLLGALAMSAMALAFMNTVTSGLMAELSRVSGASGRLNSLRQLASQGAILIAAPLGGWASEHWSFQQVTAGAAVVALALLLGTLLLVRERRIPAAEEKGVAAARTDRVEDGEAAPTLWTALRSRAIWLALGFILLVELAPGLNTPLIYYQQDVLHFEKTLFGKIDLVGAVAAIVAALAYARLCQKRSMRWVLPVVLVVHAVATLSWMALKTPDSALAIKALTGLTVTLSNLVIFDLATRAAPRGVEGTVLALLFAGINIALRASDMFGAYLHHVLKWSFPSLVLLNAGTTLLAVLLVPLLPRELVARRDGDRSERTPGGERA
jgi:predicted MFS family arabinose efflux permease